jgi:DtxR family transcriptional regulator, Mn-dependent transcriptional regulator
MSHDNSLSSNMEDYLEVIHHLILEHRVARVRDIASALDVKMPSVTGALKKLSEKGLVNYDPHQVITLTPEGEKIAEKLVNNHKIISRFLNKVLCIEKDIAEKNACRIEHIIDDVVLSRLLNYIEYVEGCPMVGADFIEKFGDFCEHGLDESQCKKCMASRSGEE